MALGAQCALHLLPRAPAFVCRRAEACAARSRRAACRYTKMGFGGNSDPSYVVPTLVATNDSAVDARSRKEGVSDLDFYIGTEVRSARNIVPSAHRC